VEDFAEGEDADGDDDDADADEKFWDAEGEASCS
jgi:hypothetical protein